MDYSLYSATYCISHQSSNFPPGRIAALEFFESNTTNGYVAGASPMGNTGNFSQYNGTFYTELQWKENELYTENENNWPYYIALSNRDYAWYEWFWGNDKFVGEIKKLLDSAENCGLIYITSHLELYESDD